MTLLTQFCCAFRVFSALCWSSPTEVPDCLEISLPAVCVTRQRREEEVEGAMRSGVTSHDVRRWLLFSACFRWADTSHFFSSQPLNMADGGGERSGIISFSLQFACLCVSQDKAYISVMNKISSTKIYQTGNTKPIT